MSRDADDTEGPSLPPTGSAEDGTLALEGQAADAMRASASTHGPIGRDREPDTILGVRVPHQVRVWLVPFGVLALSAGAVFYCGYCLDKARQKDAPGLWHLLSTVSNYSAQNMLGSVGTHPSVCFAASARTFW